MAYDVYKALLEQGQQRWVPFACKVVCLAQRGFADTELMRHLRRLRGGTFGSGSSPTFGFTARAHGGVFRYANI